MSAKLKEKGYEIDTLNIKVKDDENYTIDNISLKIMKAEQKQEESNEIRINTVEIGNTVTLKNEENLSDDEKNDVKKYISEAYDIDKKNIDVSQNFIIKIFVMYGNLM